MPMVVTLLLIRQVSTNQLLYADVILTVVSDAGLEMLDTYLGKTS